MRLSFPVPVISIIVYMTCGIQKVSEGCRTLETKVTGSIDININISINSTPSRAED